MFRTTTIYLLILGALFYNAALAVVNAKISPISLAHVAAVEMLIIACAALFTIKNIRLDRQAKISIGYLCFFVAIYFLNCTFALAQGNDVSLKPIRDILIIFSFLLLGQAAARSEPNLGRLLTICSALVLAVLFVELLSTDLYVSIFNVASYYSNTRGTGEELDPGVFRTALSFDGRFSFGFRQAQRLSSLFLEQTTHANFAIVLSIFLAGYWKSINLKSRAVILATIVFVILGTDSRQAFGICAMIFAGYALFPRMNKISLYAYMPAALLIMFLFFYDPDLVTRQQDDIDGRLTYSISKFFGADLETLLGMRLSERVFDSGYTYVLHAQSLLGLIGFWLLIPAVLPYRTPESRRFSHGVMIFYTANLAVSGSTIFSIKTSGLLWFLIGIIGSYEIIASRRADDHDISDSANLTRHAG